MTRALLNVMIAAVPMLAAAQVPPQAGDAAARGAKGG